MVNCIHKNCRKSAAYGVENKSPIFCKDHKELHHINVVSCICKFEGCYIQAVFGIKNTTKALFCKEHKSSVHVDVDKFIHNRFKPESD